jgi:hypothetical protein
MTKMSPKAAAASKAGKARVANMTAEQLSESARKAVKARWSRLSAEERKAWRANRRGKRAVKKAT